jgi:hypothetical protein
MTLTALGLTMCALVGYPLVLGLIDHLKARERAPAAAVGAALGGLVVAAGFLLNLL